MHPGDSFSEGELTVLGQKIVRAANDELVDLLAQLLERNVAPLLLLVSRFTISALGNGHLELAVKVVLRAEVSRVAKAEQAEVLVEVVLNWRARQNHASLAIDRVEGRVRLVV